MVVVFPAPVRSQQPEALAALHLEVEAVDRHHVSVTLHDAGAGDGRLGEPRRRSLCAARRGARNAAGVSETFVRAARVHRSSAGVVVGCSRRRVPCS